MFINDSVEMWITNMNNVSLLFQKNNAIVFHVGGDGGGDGILTRRFDNENQAKREYNNILTALNNGEKIYTISKE